MLRQIISSIKPTKIIRNSFNIIKNQARPFSFSLKSTQAHYQNSHLFLNKLNNHNKCNIHRFISTTSNNIDEIIQSRKKSFSDRLKLFDSHKSSLRKLDITDTFDTHYALTENSCEIIKKEVNKELGECAKNLRGWCLTFSEKGRDKTFLKRVARVRKITEDFFDDASSWAEKILDVLANDKAKSLSDEAVLALYNINNIVKKYYRCVHKMDPAFDEWSLQFPIKSL